ncbi:dihydrolipoyl dehydrogenase [Acetobacterium wieringae]|uniref:Dihydrolipoyl dehydrogenase n=1 Tax=Acetobacterium wieringae TaxID=52694 RepID=A0ABY6HDI7_9FIRM|nr:dihydrolipoyl dehydrogenase [Acetobacterium wieringae]MEA4807236.1 dihydrolipoyl dehydrogenase [Acetobacterium wieringae]UYO62571.1 dihydrolipoyl dehydrogenase [Acetobacterium wieringae]VUZ23311.1 Dihydrolipoyl dehydrogenase [Acetobacterium wieringae]
MKYDVAVLGGGPGGYEAAIRCSQYGLKTVLIEARELGGTCLNRGCIPTKALLHGAEFYDEAKGAQEFGVLFNNLAFDYEKLAAYKDKIVSRLRKGIEGLEKAHGVTVIKGFGVLKNANEIAVNGETVVADHIILATGSAPFLPPIPGVDNKSVMTSDEVLEMKQCPESLVIIGGGIIGIEFATLYASLGKKVTVIEMQPDILKGIDKEIVKELSQILKRKGVQIIAGAKVTGIEEAGEITVNYEKDGQLNHATGSHCIVSVGRKAQIDQIGLDAVGIKLSGSFIEVDTYLRTNIPNIYAIGDITGKIQLAHVATKQGMVAAENIIGKQQRMNYEVVPSCLYTNPEIAWIGLSEEEAIKAGKNIKIGRYGVGGNGKSSVMGHSKGLIKLVCDHATGEVYGAQIMAPRATDMIGEIAIIMECEGTIEELSDTIHPHPTVCEIILEAAHDVEGLCCNAPPKK